MFISWLWSSLISSQDKKNVIEEMKQSGELKVMVRGSGKGFRATVWYMDYMFVMIPQNSKGLYKTAEKAVDVAIDKLADRVLNDRDTKKRYKDAQAECDACNKKYEQLRLKKQLLKENRIKGIPRY